MNKSIALAFWKVAMNADCYSSQIIAGATLLEQCMAMKQLSLTHGIKVTNVPEIMEGLE